MRNPDISIGDLCYACRPMQPAADQKLKLPTSTPYGAHMDIGQYGDLNSLHWVENELDPEPNMVLCEVMYGESVVSTVKF